MLQGILSDVEDAYTVVRKYEWRVYSGSLLIIYEGGNDALPSWKVRLIDFAHARSLPGKGRDDGQLQGIRRVLELLKIRIEELEIL